MSSVVLMELTTSAADASVRNVYEQVFHQYQRDKLLIVPNEDDWLLACKILFLLTQALAGWKEKENYSACRLELLNILRWTSSSQSAPGGGRHKW